MDQFKRLLDLNYHGFTKDFYRYTWGEQDISLADDNGSFTFTTHNYIKFDTYDKETQPVGDMIEDFANITITDGPDWIDENASGSISNVTGNFLAK